jgi:hypothetical protein
VPLVFSVGGVQLIATLSTWTVGGVPLVDPDPVLAGLPPPDVLLVDVVLVDVLPLDVPLVDVPVVDVPLVDVPLVDVPLVDVPLVDVPLVDVPPPAELPAPADVLWAGTVFGVDVELAAAADELPSLPQPESASPKAAAAAK